jgi:hypothetical protein
MTASDRVGLATGKNMLAPSGVVWNWVVPALGLALLFGASLLPAITVAAAATIAITVLAPGSRRGQWSRWMSAPLAARRVAREN